MPRPPRSAAQREGAASAARCPAWELPLQEDPWLPRSPPGKGPCAALPAAAFPRLLPAPRGAWRSLGRGRGCRLAERLAWGLAVPPEPQPGSTGLERIARPGQEPEGCVCLVLEGGLAGPGAVPLLTSRRCLWCPRALLYLQELAEELTSVYQAPVPTEGAQEPEPEPERIQKKRRSRRRKEEETDSDDPAQDADFVPSKEVLLQAEEEEGSDAPLSEVSEPELEPLRGHGGKVSSAGVRAGSRAGSLPWPLLTFEQPKASELSRGDPGHLGQDSPEAGLGQGWQRARQRQPGRGLCGFNWGQRQIRVRADGDRVTGAPGRGRGGLGPCGS